MIDVNVNLSRWPFRRLPYDETPRLIEKLLASGITEAWAGSFDGLLHQDVAGVNARLTAECRSSGGLLKPVGTIHPLLPDWEDDVRRCGEQYGMHAIRLNPNYHGYRLDDPVCDQLLDLAAERQLVVQVALKMEDVRTHHPLMKVPTVDVAPLEALVRRHPQARLVILNGSGTVTSAAAANLTTLGPVYFDISHAEQVGALEQLVKVVPHERLLFGSHFPFFNLESALLKFRESELGGAVTSAIQSGNAKTLMGKK
ncbi:MAG: metal-dependent hydrolase [Planctomycetota bacterium]|nr:MAG: metal-dependent hydrolase [Planctomycetota bacterium]